MTLKVAIPAGKYILGDPCYTIRDEHWMPLLNDSNFFESPTGTVAGTQVIAFGTKYGDGTYDASNGHSYGVDAGLIGLVPLEYSLDGVPSSTTVVEFTVDTEAWSDPESGAMGFGHIVIETGDPEVDEEQNSCESCGCDIDVWSSLCDDCEADDNDDDA